MKAKTFLFSLILMAILTASCSYASVTPQEAASNSLIAPYVDSTKQQGASLLSGRYAHARAVLSRVKNDDYILAPSNLILEIGQFNSEYNAYPVNFDPYGEDLVPMYMVYDNEGLVPMLKFYAPDDNGEYENMGEYYAVIVPQGNNRFMWRLLETEAGDFRLLIPLNNAWFPENWYLGDWKCSDGSELEFSDGKVFTQGQQFGTFIISDNRIAIKTPDGERDVIFCAYEPEDDTLIMTFTSGPNGMGENAAVFTRTSAKPAPKLPTKTTPKKSQAPKFKAPSKMPSSAPKFPSSQQTPSQVPAQSQPQNMPQDFPEMPKVDFPQQVSPLEGVWGAIVNGQQWVLQYQGNQYYGWINGQPSEMGIFQLNGNIITGRTNNGVEFQARVQFDNSGRFMSFTFPNGNTINYQRMQ